MCGSFHESNFAKDRANNTNTAGNRGHKHHRIGKLTNLFIYIKILRIDVNFTLVFTLELEELCITFIERFETPVIPNKATFVDKEDRMRVRNTGFKLVNREYTNTGNIYIIHICIDIPTLFQVFKHEGNHIGRLASPLFAENENQFMRVIIFVGRIGKTTKAKTKKNYKNRKHRPSKKKNLSPCVTAHGESTLPCQGQEIRCGQAF